MNYLSPYLPAKIGGVSYGQITAGAEATQQPLSCAKQFRKSNICLLPRTPGYNILYLGDLFLIEFRIYRKRSIHIALRFIELVSARFDPGSEHQCSRISGVRC